MMTVAPTPVGGDQQVACVWETSLSHSSPLAPDTVHRELRRIVVDAHVDLTLIIEDVIGAVGNHHARPGSGDI